MTTIISAALFGLSIILCCTGGGASISWPWGARPTYQVDLSGSELTDLYNSHVSYAEYFNRPLRKKRFFFPDGILHAGVVVTTDYGGRSRWLIHKGLGYGDSSDTVVTRASDMSSHTWTRIRCGTVSSHTVDDFMKAAYVDDNYNLFTANCQTAARRMWTRLVTDTTCP